MPAAIGVSPGFQEDLGTLEVPVDHGHVEGGLPLDIHQVDLGPFAQEEVDAGAMAGGGGDAQRGAGQPAAAPHRLLVDPAGVGGRSRRSEKASGHQNTPKKPRLPSHFVKGVAPDQK